MKQRQISEKVIDIVTLGLLCAILLLAQLGMAFLPNIEPVTVLLIVYTLAYKKKVFLVIYAFVLMEGLIFGFGIWWISYLYIWSILALIVLLFQKNSSVIVWSVIAGAFGLLFGALCSIPYLISGGVGAALAYWSAGIPYDILHCAGNFTLTLILFRPLSYILNRYAPNVLNHLSD